LMIAPSIALIGFGIFLAFVISVSRGNIQRIDEVRNTAAPLMSLTNRNLDLIDRMQAAFNDAVTTGEGGMLGTASATHKTIVTNLASIRKLLPELGAQVDKTTSLLDRYHQESKSISQAMIGGETNLQTLNQRAKTKQALYDELMTELNALKTAADQHFNSITEGANDASRRSIIVGIALGSLMVVVLLSISLVIALAMRRQVEYVADSMRAIAEGEGDLTQRLRQEGSD